MPGLLVFAKKVLATGHFLHTLYSLSLWPVPTHTHTHSLPLSLPSCRLHRRTNSRSREGRTGEENKGGCGSNGHRARDGGGGGGRRSRRRPAAIPSNGARPHPWTPSTTDGP